ncbi:hypothetical protein LTS18_013309, partial [Coniosporium uncinatum]
MAPTATLSALHRVDGSATYSDAGYNILGAVNGPIEVQRRDELPEEAAIEVKVRPAVGVGSTRERHLESILHATLKGIILTHQFPRTLIQLTLQVVSVPEAPASHSRWLDPLLTLPLLPPLLPPLPQTSSLLTLLSASLPVRTTFMSTIVATLPPDEKGGGQAVLKALIDPKAL